MSEVYQVQQGGAGWAYRELDLIFIKKERKKANQKNERKSRKSEIKLKEKRSYFGYLSHISFWKLTKKEES